MAKSRNFMANCCLRTKLRVVFSLRLTYLTFLYFMPRSSLMTLETSPHLYFVPCSAFTWSDNLATESMISWLSTLV